MKKKSTGSLIIPSAAAEVVHSSMFFLVTSLIRPVRTALIDTSAVSGRVTSSYISLTPLRLA